MDLKNSSTTASRSDSRRSLSRNRALARISSVAGTCAGVLLIAAPSLHSADRAGSDDRVERGRHLVHDVAMCIDCHSPRGEDGQFQTDQHLTGAAIGFAPIVPMPAWAPTAPPLKGLPGYTDAQATHFLMTGERPNGQPPARPPMLPYRFDRDEAEAVVAYLRTLP